MPELYGGLMAGSVIGGLGISALNNGIGALTGSTARHENYQYGEMAADNAMARNRSMYMDLYSPKAKLQQLKDAGLSPSLMYQGAAGQGGFSGAPQGTGATGIQNPFTPMSAMDLAQVANLNAQTEKTKAETKTINGENERGLAEIAKTWADANYTQVATALKEQEVVQQQWQNYITSETAESTINMLAANAEEAANAALKSTFEMISASAQAQVDEATIKSRIEQAQKNVEYTDAQILLTKSGIKLNEAQTQRAIAEISKWQKELKIEQEQLAINLYNSRTQRAQWKTYDEFVERQCNVLEKRLGWDKDLGERQFTKALVESATNTFFTAVNTLTPVPKTVNHTKGK